MNKITYHVINIHNSKCNNEYIIIRSQKLMTYKTLDNDLKKMQI